MEKIFKTTTEIDIRRNRRKKLLTLWMKLFLAFQIAISLVVVFAIIFDEIAPNFEINLYGFRAQPTSSFSFMLLSCLLLANLMSSILLIRGIKFGLKFGKLNYQIGIVVCVMAFLLKIYFNDSKQLYFPLEIIVLFLILNTLTKIEKKWSQNFV